ncbi:MAG: hypothetical protein GX442_10750 [Candidatus Riflebacteria bacterium]|nr:hypothetical protein [Candidatus Riflebacteria bacterium]
MSGSSAFSTHSQRSPSRRLLWPALLLLALATSCVNEGDLRFNPVSPGEKYRLAGSLVVPELTESDLLASARGPAAEIKAISDFSVFTLTAGGKTTRPAKDGSFVLADVPFGPDLVLTATAGKVTLMKRLYPRDLRMTDVSKLKVTLDSTVRALLWQKAHARDVELTEWDIAAREYEPALASLTTALKLALQLPKGSVPTTVLALPAVDTPATALAAAILPREADLREAWSVLQNALMNEKADLLSHYLSPEFTNDWDSTSSWHDFNEAMAAYFKACVIASASYTILDMEFLPGEQARIRTAGQVQGRYEISEIPFDTGVYTSDVFWRKEGTFWKIRRNLPYRPGHPTQVMADSRWGEIARAHADLQTAIFREDLATLEKHVSPTFGNDWDVNSTYADLLNTARSRFNACDVKTASFTIRFIDIIDDTHARVHCSADVLVIRLAPGVDAGTGPIRAVVDWRREDGVWKLYRNLPYRFTHPRDIP